VGRGEQEQQCYFPGKEIRGRGGNREKCYKFEEERRREGKKKTGGTAAIDGGRRTGPVPRGAGVPAGNSGGKYFARGLRKKGREAYAQNWEAGGKGTWPIIAKGGKGGRAGTLKKAYSKPEKQTLRESEQCRRTNNWVKKLRGERPLK